MGMPRSRVLPQRDKRRLSRVVRFHAKYASRMTRTSPVIGPSPDPRVVFAHPLAHPLGTTRGDGGLLTRLRIYWEQAERHAEHLGGRTGSPSQGGDTGSNPVGTAISDLT
jgi:hypothetical protein